MALDKTTEIIWHFIGMLVAGDTGARLRDADDGFHFRSTPDATFQDAPQTIVLFRAPHALEGYDPGLTPFRFAPLPPGPWSAPDPLPIGMISAGSFGIGPLPEFSARLPGASQDNLKLLLPAPSPPDTFSVLSVQANTLIDHDIYGEIDPSAFVAHAELDAQLIQIRTDAQPIMTKVLDPSDAADLLDPQAGSVMASTFRDQQAAAGDLQADAHFTQNAAVAPVNVNGAAADTMPDLSDILPAHRSSDSAAADAGGPSFAATGSAATAAAFFDVDAGHLVKSGSNLAINEALVSVMDIDAPAIAVMGDVTAMTAISQVNVLVDHDSGAINVSPSQTSVNAAAFVSRMDTAAPAPVPPVLPFHDISAEVTRVDADLMTINWMSQYNFISDHDTAQVVFSGKDTYLDFGDNIALNQTSLAGFAQGYDLIFVGGSMIDISLISQSNLVFDNDIVDFGPLPAFASMGGNLVYNAATIHSTSVDTFAPLDSAFRDAGTDLAAGATQVSGDVLSHGAFAGQLPLDILYIAGDFISVSAIQQTNIIGDADQIHLPKDGLDKADVSTGSNAAVNIATIVDQGVDSTIMVGGEVYDDLLLYQAALVDTDDQPLDHMPSELASEAVVFLADGMIEPDTMNTPDFAQNHESMTAAADIMGSVIA